MIDQTTAPAPFSFKFQKNPLRVLPHGNGVSFWVVGADLARALAYQDATNALRQVPDNHKGLHPLQTPGGIQNLLCVDEPGMYRLVLRSNKPEAEPFMEWVTAEVLPAIRRHGSYDAKAYATIDNLHEGEAKLKAEVARLKDELLDALRGQVRLLGRPRRAPPRPISDDERRQMHDLRASGVTRSELERRFKRSGSTVHGVLSGERPVA